MDVITGGSPCQNLSVAGNREGLKGSESRLFLEQIRIIKEMREHDRANGRTGNMVRPRYGIWENVPGALSSPGKENTGKDFQQVLTEFVRIAEPDAPTVPLPTQGKWSKCGLLYDEMGGVVCGMENYGLTVFRSSAETETDCFGCRLQWTICRRDFV